MEQLISYELPTELSDFTLRLIHNTLTAKGFKVSDSLTDGTYQRRPPGQAYLAREGRDDNIYYLMYKSSPGSTLLPYTDLLYKFNFKL